MVQVLHPRAGLPTTAFRVLLERICQCDIVVEGILLTICNERTNLFKDAKSTLEILAGHNRVNASKLAGLTDISHSEKAAVISVQHLKGKIAVFQ
jgi:hypothetical protein